MCLHACLLLNILIFLKMNLKGQYSIPNSFQDLCKMKEVYLSSNTLIDQLQDLMDKLSCAKNTLEFLQLSNNSFTGPFPDIAKFSSLKSFYANSNKLNGTLPVSLGTLPDFSGASSLQILSLSHNKIKGILLESIGNLSKLKLLDLSSNSLNATVSEYKLSNLYDLQTLDVFDNSLKSKCLLLSKEELKKEN